MKRRGTLPTSSTAGAASKGMATKGRLPMGAAADASAVTSRRNIAAPSESNTGRVASRLSRTRSARGGLASLHEQLQPGYLQAGGGVINQEILKNLSAQDIRDLRLVFDTFDTHSRGYVNEHELRRAMKCLGFKMSQKAVQEAIDDVGLGSTAPPNSITFEEFLQCVILHQGDSRDMHEEILQGFRMFDTGHKGKIMLADLKRVCDETGEKFSEQELQEMIEEADRDGDNAVSKQEFVNIMLRTNLFQ